MVAAVKTFFIWNCLEIDFQIGGCRRSCRGEPMFDLAQAVAAVTAAATARDSADVRFLTLRADAASCVLKREQAARSRRCAP